MPDGSVSGPYAVWQLGGLVVTVLVAVCFTVVRGHSAALWPVRPPG
ncbi:hypothetical protein ACFV2H_11385 [Streptomyces sp. NPDC059629]